MSLFLISRFVSKPNVNDRDFLPRFVYAITQVAWRIEESKSTCLPYSAADGIRYHEVA